MKVDQRVERILDLAIIKEPELFAQPPQKRSPQIRSLYS